MKHDLAKYLTLNQRWLATNPTVSELRLALRDDLLETRRGPNGSRDAWQVWQDFGPELLGERAYPHGYSDLSADEGVSRIDAGMRAVRRSLGDLANDALSEVQLLELAVVCGAVVEAVLDVAQRAQREEGAWQMSSS